jgi:hypothetical protein
MYFQIPELNMFTSTYSGGPDPRRATLLGLFSAITGNGRGGYPEYLRNVSVSQGASQGTSVGHSQPILFGSDLTTSLYGVTHQEFDCQGVYTVYHPVSTKTTIARWWGSNNSANIFDGGVYLNTTWTYMGRMCNYQFGTCTCIGPFVWSGKSAVVGNQHIPKPSSPQNFEDVPASVVATQNILFRSSAYQYYGQFPFGGAVTLDANMHGIAPVTSVLDLKDPNNPSLPAPFTLSAESAGLLMIRHPGSGLVQHPQKRFGFPHLSYSSNPYLVTPYDAVYSVGTNNIDVNSNVKPDNQCHVEDVQAPVADYLSQVEVAPELLFMSNQTIGQSASAGPNYMGGYIAEFEARNTIVAGKTSDGTSNIYELYNNLNWLTPNGDLKVAIGTKAIIHAGNSVELYPGFEVPQGADAALYIDFFGQSPACTTNVLQRNSSSHNYGTVPLIAEDIGKKDIVIMQSGIEIYPNPVKDQITIANYEHHENSQLQIFDLGGKLVFEREITGNGKQSLELSTLQNGIYLMQIHDKKFKLIVSK